MDRDIALALIGGLGLGLGYFGGLLWTVRRLARSPAPGLLFVGSFLLRAGAAAAGLWALGEGDVRRLLAAGLGLLAARPLLTRVAAPRPAGRGGAS